MEDERLLDWSPVPFTGAEPVVVEGVSDEEGGLVITVKVDGVTSRLVFSTFVAYRNINESYRHRFWRTHSPVPPFSVVRPSAWLSWLELESDGVVEAVDVTHYAICTAEDCIDVASGTPPTVGSVG